MFAIFATINTPDTASGGETAEFVSPEGRIRIALVESYSASNRPDTQSPEGPPPTPTTMYVPSYLPDRMSRSDARLLTETSPGQSFMGGDSTLMIVQAPGASFTAKAGFVEAIDVDGRLGFFIRGDWAILDESAAWDPDRRVTLLLEMDDATVIMHSDGGGLTEQEIVRIASSLEPDHEALASLTREEASQYESIVQHKGPDFGTLYAPTYLPEDYSYSRTGSEAVPQGGFVELRYRKFCELVVRQYAQGSSMGPDIVRKAMFGPHKTVVEPYRDGVYIHPGYRKLPGPVQRIQFYVSDPHPVADAEHWFEHEGFWINIRTSAHPRCEAVSLDEVARIASSLRPVD